MQYFIPKDVVIDAINYFKELSVDSDDNLFLYLLAKHMGISTTYPITFLGGNLTADQKNEYLNAVWLFGGLFDSTEIGEKRSIIFPNNFKRVGYYQPGTEYRNIMSQSRIKDTIQKKNIIIPVYDDNNSYLKLKRNYQEVIGENYLKGNKISFKYLTAWLFRYTKFDFETTPSEKELFMAV